MQEFRFAPESISSVTFMRLVTCIASLTTLYTFPHSPDIWVQPLLGRLSHSSVCIPHSEEASVNNVCSLRTNSVYV